ncbi:MAG: hypothetical protein LBL57_00410 [Tannerella sp.]|jgi:AraC-like DNA-binding protein|nr:hypothetical protein [Tannerella sp.]
MDFLLYLNMLIMLVPVMVAGCCMTLAGISRRDCRTRQERRLKGVVILYLATTFPLWLALFCRVFFPEASVFINISGLAGFVPAVVLFCHTVRSYCQAGGEEGLTRRLIFRIVLMALLSPAFLFMTVFTGLLPVSGIGSPVWTTVTAFCLSGQCIALTFHIIRREYPFLAVYATEEETEKSAEGRRLHEGKLTRRRLEAWFRKKKPYLRGDFKITDAAKAMDVNRSVISAFINKNYGMNFNRFVNRWRLEELERLRLLPSNKGKSIAQLFAKAGFTEARQYRRAVEAGRG